MVEKGMACHMSPWLSWDNMPGSDSGSHEGKKSGRIVEFLSSGPEHSDCLEERNWNKVSMRRFEQFSP